MKFLHTADIHLDSPLCGLEAYEGAPIDQIRGATRRALENLVYLGIEEKVAFILICGDLFDGDWKDYSTGLFFLSQMQKLKDAGIRVFIIQGNHDAASQITKRLTFPNNVFLFPSAKPFSFKMEDQSVALHGQSYARPAVTEDLSAGYPEPISGFLNIGLLHTCAGGRPGHANYAPCSLDGLLAKGYDYWALGHVHQREVLHERPWIVFPGNIQGRHIKETGKKGCSLVSIKGHIIESVENYPLDVFRWSMCEVDACGAGCGEEVVERVRLHLDKELAASDGLPIAVRLRVAGKCAAHTEVANNPERWISEIRALANEYVGEVWVEKVQFATSGQVDIDAIIKGSNPIADLFRFIRELPDQETILQEILSEFQDLKLKLPHEFRLDEDALRLDDAENLRYFLPYVEQLLASRIFK